ncbi:hypothetical protein KI387_034575, partial [Taxus chinensis]
PCFCGLVWMDFTVMSLQRVWIEGLRSLSQGGTPCFLIIDANRLIAKWRMPRLLYRKAC